MEQKLMKLKRLLLSSTAIAIVLASCSDNLEIDQPVDNPSNIPCIADEFGNCDDGIIPIGGGGNNHEDDGNNNNDDDNNDDNGISPRFQTFYRGESGRENTIFTSHSTNGIDQWQADVPINGGSAQIKNSSITAVLRNNVIIVAHKGANNTDKIYTSYSSNGIDFSPDQVVGNGARTNGNVKLVTFGTKTFMYYTGSSNETKLYYSSTQTFNGVGWSGNQQIGSKEYLDFDLVKSQDGTILYLIGLDFSGIFVQSSLDGINFTDVNRLNTATSIESISVTGHFDDLDNRNNIILVTVEDSSPNDVDLFVLKCNADFSTIGNTLFPVRTSSTATIARTDDNPSITSNGERLVVAFEEKNGNRVFTAHSLSGTFWGGNTAARGSTNNSGVEIIYTGPLLPPN